MSEQTQEVAVKSSEDLQKEFDSLPAEFQKAVTLLNESIQQHNTNVAIIQAANKNDPKILLQEARENNPSNNQQIAAINAKIDKLQDAIEKLIAEANKVIVDNNLLPATKTPEQIEELRGTISASGKDLRDKANALTLFEKMVPGTNLTQHVIAIETLRGVSTASNAGGSTTPKLRFTRITVNGETESGNHKVFGLVDNKEKYTFTFTTHYLKKVFPGIKVVANELTSAYLKNVDKDNLPAEHTFEIPWTYNKDGNEVTENISITAFRD